MKFAERMEPIQPSPTLAVTARAKQLRSQGEDVIGFGAGEPDFDTPPHIVEAMIRAARSGATRYAPVAGLPELRAAAAGQLGPLYGVELEAEDVLVTVGGKQGLFNLFQLLVDPGDEVIVPAPYWVSYPPQIRVAGGTPTVVPTRADDGFRLDPARVEEAVGPRTVGLLVNSPNNPTGAVQSAEDLRALADLAERRDLWIVSDDIYSYIRYDDGPFRSVLGERPELRDRIVVLHGASKTYAMTGWRIGFVVAPREAIQKLSALQGQQTSGATTFAQHGALAAITGDHAFLDDWLAAYEERRRRMVEGLNAIGGIACPRPGGAFYVFPDVSGLLGRTLEGRRLDDDFALCEALIDHAGVACVPGSPFGAPGHVRLSYACSADDVDRGLERIAEVVRRMS